MVWKATSSRHCCHGNKVLLRPADAFEYTTLRPEVALCAQRWLLSFEYVAPGGRCVNGNPNKHSWFPEYLSYWCGTHVDCDRLTAGRVCVGRLAVNQRKITHRQDNVCRKACSASNTHHLQEAQTVVSRPLPTVAA